MTIDETIEMYKKIANTDSNCPRYCMNPCEDCAKECKQVAEWLEELKSYRASVFSGDMTQTMLKEEYCKAINDFAEKLNAKCDGMIKEKWNSNVAPISWAEAYADIKDDIDEIAEQLKAGITND